MVCDALIRILQTSEFDVPPVQTSDTEADVVVVTIRDAHLISQAFGNERVKELQNKALERISHARPHAFLIARLGYDRLIIIEHPGQGATLTTWTDRISRICHGLKLGGGLELDLKVEIGEVDRISEELDDQTPNDGQVVRIPTANPIGALAG